MNYNALLETPLRRVRGFRAYNPIVRQEIEYPRIGKRRGRAFNKFCNELFKQVAATLKRELADAGRYLPELAYKWKIAQAVDWHFAFYKRHYIYGYKIPLQPPEWLISELQRRGNWRPKLRLQKGGRG